MHRPSSGNKTQITILACANAMGNMRQKKMLEKSTRKKQTKENTEIGISDSEPTESGVQSNEISNNEYVHYALVCMKMTCL